MNWLIKEEEKLTGQLGGYFFINVTTKTEVGVP